MLRIIEDAVRKEFPLASVKEYGSHPAGLSTFLSDIDLSVNNILFRTENPSNTQKKKENGEVLRKIRDAIRVSKRSCE